MRKHENKRLTLSGFMRVAAVLVLALFSAGAVVAQDAVTTPSAQGKTSFLDFPGKLNYHMAAGWTSTGLLLAAVSLGVAHALDLMNRGHDVRDSLGIVEENDPAIAGALSSIWENGQALRWLHIGFLAAGETLYLGNAVTGLSMKLPKGERTLASNIHLISFFTHATLMASEVIIGVMTTDALRRGDHEAHLGLVTAHAVIGVTIPIVMAGAGWAATADLSFLTGR